jgi:hypothetical protein
MMRAKLASSFIGVSSVFHPLDRNGTFFISRIKDGLYLFYIFRMWWNWKGNKPDPYIVDFMNRTYPSDWTYADFAKQFRAEFYGN